MGKQIEYLVRTYDWDLERFTPQFGLSIGPWSKWSLRNVIRRLRNMGYEGRRGDACVLIERLESMETA